MRKYEVIYLTGPPATGKTTLIKQIKEALPEVSIFIYSELLSDHISKRQGTNFSQTNLREKSAAVVGNDDIEAVDEYLISQVCEARKTKHVLIDSHPVTKEAYGFRITAFSTEKLLQVAPTRICMLFTKSDVVIERIRNDAKGRPEITPFEADFHCFAQAAVAANYGIVVGAPVYLYDVSDGSERAFSEITKRLR